MMVSQAIFKESSEYAGLFDLIEAEAVKALETIKPGEDEEELSEDEALKMSLIVDYKYRAQEFLETSFLYLNKIKELI